MAFAELLSYFKKPNRNAWVVSTNNTNAALKKALEELKTTFAATQELDRLIKKAALLKSIPEADSAFRSLLPKIVNIHNCTYAKALEALQEHMDLIGSELATKWEDERYVRELAEDDD